MAALWTINTLNDALVELGNLLIQTITGFIELQSTTWSVQNAFDVMLLNPTGFFPGDDGVYRWPSTESEGFNHQDDDWKLDGAD